MTNYSDATDYGSTRPGPEVLRDEDDNLNPLWIEALRAELDQDAVTDVVARIEPLHASDVGDLLEALEPDERLHLIQLLGPNFDYSALTEVDENVRAELMEALPSADIARGVAELDSDDAVYILEDIEAVDREAILAQLPAFDRLSLKRSLDFPEDSAGRRMQTEYIAIPPYYTVGQTIDYMRSEKDLPEDFYQLYVVDPGYQLLGIIPLDKFLRSKRDVRIEDLMNRNVITVEATEDQEEAARDFERYDLVETGVVDENGRMVGVLTVDDIVDVINEEATEDIKRMGGVGDEELSDRLIATVRSRAPWLLVNLISALIVSFIISLFNGTIEQMVALAALMPIVASMGGNAATQTMTVTVRALATRDLDRGRVRRLIVREMSGGFLNGCLFAVLIGCITWVRYLNPGLGVVIGLAMIINMIAAGTAGILLPLLLNKLKIDPAIASSVFVTTVTDVVGFFAFLGIAGLWFGLF
ncbi:magnesium transporter [Devosia sp.]|uniref:magnesium transporter n=1 Tax=Devosia sp. TaxID=1871048 RepID=UPI003A928590